jgi:hypothetical protein
MHVHDCLCAFSVDCSGCVQQSVNAGAWPNQQKKIQAHGCLQGASCTWDPGLGLQSTVWGDSHMLPSRGVRVWVVYLTPKIERIIVLLSASPEGEARRRC